MLDALDPFGAALLTNLVIDAVRLSQNVRKGDLRPDQFGTQMVAKVKDRLGFTALTVGAVWVAGPLGLLVPIIVRRSIEDGALQREAVNAWNGVSDVMRAEFESRIKSAALLDKMGQHYRSADASTKGSQRATKAIASDLGEVQKLLGYTPGPTPAAGA